MLTKLTRHGDELALVVDRPLLELLQIDADTPLEVRMVGQQLIVEAATPSDRRKKFEAAQEMAHQRYGKAFQKLAE